MRQTIHKHFLKKNQLGNQSVLQDKEESSRLGTTVFLHWNSNEWKQMQSTEVSVIIDQMITVQLRNHVLMIPQHCSV